MVLPVRPPLPGGALTDVQLLGDGRLALAVATTVQAERQAWLLDPATAHVERVGATTREDTPPAGVVMAPDGQHSVALLRGAGAPGTPARPDLLMLDGPEGRRPLLLEGVLARDERVRDLAWAPDSGSMLLLSQRPVVGLPAGTVHFRLPWERGGAGGDG